MAKVYVASSWRNEYQQQVVERLRAVGAEVYDFKHPNGGKGFSWSDVDPDWKNWDVKTYVDGLEHKMAVEGFKRDFEAMKKADICVLVLPCGRSAHAEAGWMAGARKTVIAYIPKLEEAELMYNLFYAVTDSLDEVCSMVERYGKK